MPAERDEFKGMSKNDLIREVVRLRAMLADQLAAAPGVGESVDVQGIVGMRDGRPLVHVRAGEAAWQWTPAEVRRHALLTLNAAVEAERDAATIAFVREDLEQDEQAAGAFLMGMREHRAKWSSGLGEAVPDVRP